MDKDEDEDEKDVVGRAEDSPYAHATKKRGAKGASKAKRRRISKKHPLGSTSGSSTPAGGEGREGGTGKIIRSARTGSKTATGAIGKVEAEGVGGVE